MTQEQGNGPCAAGRGIGAEVLMHDVLAAFGAPGVLLGVGCGVGSCMLARVFLK